MLIVGILGVWFISSLALFRLLGEVVLGIDSISVFSFDYFRRERERLDYGERDFRRGCQRNELESDAVEVSYV